VVGIGQRTREDEGGGCELQVEVGIAINEREAGEGRSRNWEGGSKGGGGIYLSGEPGGSVLLNGINGGQ